MPRSHPGELNPSARLTWTQVRHMRALYARGGYTYTELGRIFGVHRCTATAVVQGHRWIEPSEGRD